MEDTPYTICSCCHAVSDVEPHEENCIENYAAEEPAEANEANTELKEVA